MTHNALVSPALLDRLETYYDTVPRNTLAPEDFGSLVLFLQDGAGWPYYARPKRGHAAEPTVGDVAVVRLRQRELGVPEAFEWVHETTPSLREAATRAGLHVHSHPLMALDAEAFRRAARPAPPPDVEVRRITPDALDLAIVQSVAPVAFAAPGTAIGPAGPELRDAAAPGQPPELLRYVGDRLRGGHLVTYAAYGPKGPLSVGSHQPRGTVSEIVAVGTLPSARRQGLAAAITWHLVADALDVGADLVFLSAG
ncbi:MAG: GNAT family N-acetyltransferase, partial [Streptomycetaceae bacterium]|nr:GNAT family N-acetyltransferase [Streptomycetaceae bacterium]